ncbi:MAG: alanine racemase [Patescibacteria group bacterium]
MLEALRNRLKPKYETLNRLEINRQRLLDNYLYLSGRQPQAALFPVLKSNAYGHGLKEVCLVLNAVKPPLVVVDSYPEAQIVYRHFHGSALILGEMPPAAYRYARLEQTEFVVYNPETLKSLSRYGRKARIHLFFNSGMNREGIADLARFIRENKTYLDQVQVNGFCSHLAAAEQDSELNQRQAASFQQGLSILRSAGYAPCWIHLGNSAAIFTQQHDWLTAFRPGLAFYGYSPFAGQAGREELAAGLRPALEVYSQIIARQEVKAGSSVSYNETFRAAADSRIGVIPFGYFEGLDRRLSNRAKFMVQTKTGRFQAQVAGPVCMNLTCLDCGRHEIAVGDPVQIVSANPSDENSLINLARIAQMIPYEFLVKFQANIRKKIV